MPHTTTQHLLDQLSTTSGRKRIPILTELAYRFFQSDSYRGEQYAREALELARQLKDKMGQANALNCLGWVHMLRSDYAEALALYRQALAICEEMGSARGQAMARGNMAVVYQKQSDYPRALRHHLSALQFFEALDDPEMVAAACGNIANIYRDQEAYERAVDYFERALSIHRQLNDPDAIAFDLHSLGVVYDYQDRPKKALDFYEKALTFIPRDKPSRILRNIHAAIGKAYLRTKQHLALAQDHLQQTLDIEQQLDISYGNNHLALGKCYKTQQQYDLAEQQMLEGIALAKQSGQKKYIKAGYEELADLYKQMGQFENALQCHEQMFDIHVEVFNDEKARQLSAIRTQYETEKKEQENLRLKQELDHHKEELLLHVRTLARKNQLIREIQQHFHQAKKQEEPIDISKILSRLNTNKSRKEEWAEFCDYFAKLHPHFLDELTQSFPKLTRQEQKICALIKLGLSSKQIAEAIFISVRGVENHRYNIRKKVDLPADQTLTDAIRSDSILRG